MPTLTPAQHRKVHRLLEPRALDAAKNIFRVSLGLDPDQVSNAAMMEMSCEICKVFYPILGRFISGEPMDAPIFAPSPIPDSPKLTDLKELLQGILTVPDFPGLQRLKESAQKMQEWLDA
jgi:hypothetical protein